MTSPSLIDQARSALADSASGTRIAAWISRAALEDAVRDLLLAQGADPGKAGMRTQLSCVQSLYETEPEVAEDAEYAWSALSDACHQHAYQLDAAASEVAHLIGLVERLQERAEGRNLLA